MIPWLDPRDPFPPISRALTEPNGLLAAGADLSPGRLIDAYRCAKEGPRQTPGEDPRAPWAMTDNRRYVIYAHDSLV
jgi:Leu/Phe-tRNA-protein transferase